MSEYSGWFAAGYLFCAAQTIGLAIAWAYATAGGGSAGPESVDPVESAPEQDDAHL